jgi:DNA mismatch endonuclease (patch repair protein)
MQANRRRDTKPELEIRRALHARGLRYRVDLPIRTKHARPIRPDIVFTRARTVVFVDGCFWHGCPIHGRRERIANAEYWRPKIQGNTDRDLVHTRALEAEGWSVLRVWEHTPPEEAVQAILKALGHARISHSIP